MLKSVVVYEYVSREGNPWRSKDAVINTDDITSAIALEKEGSLDDAKMMVTFKNGQTLRIKGYPYSLLPQEVIK